MCGDRVRVDPDEADPYPVHVVQAGLLGYLAPCRRLDRVVDRFEVATWLEPSAQLGVVDQEQ